MTGTMLRVPGTGEVLTPEACRGGSSMFDGRLRYDLKLDFKRMETVKAERGYHGPAVVCAVYFTPVAGYIPDRPVIKYLATERRIEIAFVPIAGTRILVPFRNHPDAVRPRGAGSDAVRHHGRAAAGGEDAVVLSIVAWPSISGGTHSCRHRMPVIVPSFPRKDCSDGAAGERRATEHRNLLHFLRLLIRLRPPKILRNPPKTTGLFDRCKLDLVPSNKGRREMLR